MLMGVIGGIVPGNDFTRWRIKGMKVSATGKMEFVLLCLPGWLGKITKNWSTIESADGD